MKIMKIYSYQRKAVFLKLLLSSDGTCYPVIVYLLAK